MLDINEEALPHCAALLVQARQDSCIRIAVMGGGSKGPALGLVVDDVKQSDVLIRHGSLPFIIDRNLLDYCQTITIGFRSGSTSSCGGSDSFLISSKNPLSF